MVVGGGEPHGELHGKKRRFSCETFPAAPTRPREHPSRRVAIGVTWRGVSYLSRSAVATLGKNISQMASLTFPPPSPPHRHRHCLLLHLAYLLLIPFHTPCTCTIPSILLSPSLRLITPPWYLLRRAPIKTKTDLCVCVPHHA